MAARRFGTSVTSRVHTWNINIVNGVLSNPEFQGSEMFEVCKVIGRYAELDEDEPILDIDIDKDSQLLVNGNTTGYKITGKFNLIKDATVLQVLYNQYFKSVCASNKKKLKYPVVDRIPEVGIERIFEKSYKFSEMWLDLGVQVIYHHSEIYDLLKAKKYFFWTEPYTSMVFYTNMFVANR